MKILMVFGTRPEAIKLAPLILALKKNKLFRLEVCVSAQHREMLDQALEVFSIEPDFDMNIMKKGQDLFDITTKVLKSCKMAIKKICPDIVLVHGDTTTATAAAMSAFYAGVPIGHIEAGLRTNDIKSPFPEEFNRKLIGMIAKWHFAPTELSKKNLILEGVNQSDITVTGNTVIDALYEALKNLNLDTEKRNLLINKLNSELKFDFLSKKYILITGHRREKFGDKINEICMGIRFLADKHKEINFVYPVHLNPNITNPVKEILGSCENVKLIAPQAYEPFLLLLKNCFLVITDSGGIQEEAPSLGKPVLVTRDTTERPEAVNAGTVRLIGSSRALLIESVEGLFENQSAYELMAKAKNPYGDGRACERIINKLEEIRVDYYFKA